MGGRHSHGVPKGLRPAKTIVLIGPMAVGKSVVGAALADTLGLDFVDTDQQVVAKHGAISGIFASHGERHFRRLEAKAVADVLDKNAADTYVLSLGGGAVLDSGTQQLLARATVVYLKADLETVKDRILRNSGRPLLAQDPLEQWDRLAKVRAPVYAKLADITVDVNNYSVPELVQSLLSRLGQAGGDDSTEENKKS